MDDENHIQCDVDNCVFDENYYDLSYEKGYGMEIYLKETFFLIAAKDRGFAAKILEVWGVELTKNC